MPVAPVPAHLPRRLRIAAAVVEHRAAAVVEHRAVAVVVVEHRTAVVAAATPAAAEDTNVYC
jgi:hypothetical protein